MSRQEVRSKLEERIAEGKKIQAGPFHSEDDLDGAEAARARWTSYNIEFVTRAFDNDSVAVEYKRVSQCGGFFMNASLGQLINGFVDGIGGQINSLMAIVERLDLIPEVHSIAAQPAQLARASLSKTAVFIVHGRDDAAKTEVARFVEKLGLQAVILHEQANQGRTIIEKFEQHAAQVEYAIVLLTPDDMGGPKEQQDIVQPRARQNVILELGYFCGVLGRKNVSVIYWPGVELPSDINGLAYTPYDPKGGWNLPLAREMKLAGLEVDLNKAL